MHCCCSPVPARLLLALRWCWPLGPPGSGVAAPQPGCEMLPLPLPCVPPPDCDARRLTLLLLLPLPLPGSGCTALGRCSGGGALAVAPAAGMTPLLLAAALMRAAASDGGLPPVPALVQRSNSSPGIACGL
jgi:hypothetical protein